MKSAFIKYKLQEFDGKPYGVQKISDKGTACIAPSMNNKYWVEYQEWLGAGNTPEPAETQEEIDVREQAESKYSDTVMIRDRMEDMAIEELKKEGKLPDDFKKG